MEVLSKLGTRIENAIPKSMRYEALMAGPNYNRWLFPPAALLIHFCIGQAYGYSVFNKPLTKLCGPEDTATCKNWNLVQIGWVFTTFMMFGGGSAAVLGKWLEKMGPRVSGVMASFCWGGGYLISAIGVKYHLLPLLFIGNGIIGGIGLGSGYISPVSTLMKWFPDKRGLATGLAIMGFGGGAVIGAPLGVLLMNQFALSTVYLIMGVTYLSVMLIGAFSYRVPPEGFRPEGWVPPAKDLKHLDGTYCDADTALKTPQFWLLFTMLWMNCSCGIGVIGQLSLMTQEMFGLKPSIAGGLVGLLSIFNIGGRFLWSTVSDKLGRWPVYTIYFLLGIPLYAFVPTVGHDKNFPAFFAMIGVILSMYGGGFSTVPAYISDLFGVKNAGAIHGRVLTAWSAAAVVGPYMLNSIRVSEAKAGRPVALAYDKTMYILCGLLAVGLVANLLLPVANKYYPVPRNSGRKVEQPEASKNAVATTVVVDMEEGRVDVGQGKVQAETSTAEASPAKPAFNKVGPTMVAVTLLWWSIPAVGFGWGLYEVIMKGIVAFNSFH